ncbi:MAG: lipid-A-disaccharide synthase-related protein [Spirulinaceae cyanobacterium]
MKLLCLSNGHGEDAIAVRILRSLQAQTPDAAIAALPLVGEGHAYAQAEIPIAGPVKQMPSGGFVYMDGRQLWRDVRGGLIGLTLAQYRLVRRWRKQGGQILAVGDIVPLLLAWLSGTDYAFVGTAKSEYYLRDEGGWLNNRRSEGWAGSVYLPWEQWLMRRSRCKAIFPRDGMTTRVLKRLKVRAQNLGNPMMDGLDANLSPQWQAAWETGDRPLAILLLPGSRAPEAESNWRRILDALSGVGKAYRNQPILYLAAIAPSLETETFHKALVEYGWQPQAQPPALNPLRDTEAYSYRQGMAQLMLTQQGYNGALAAADAAIAMAGTATEQFVGLGKPVVSMPGFGPQFTPQFAEAQTRLLGVSVCLAPSPQNVGVLLQGILSKPDLLQIIGENGKRRMGEPGAGDRIAEQLLSLWS